jgi:hypothetical protein
MTPGDAPEREDVRPPGLARWMVKHSLRTKVREEGLAAFEDEFAERFADTNDLTEARSWSLRVGWDSLQQAYKPAIDIGMYILAIIGVVLAVITIL